MRMWRHLERYFGSGLYTGIAKEALKRYFWPVTSKRYLTVVLPLMVAEWILFKWFYPYADYFTDSYTYIHAAWQGDWISYRPIGYSLFLRAVHALNHSDTFLVTLQYVLVQGACLGLFGMLVKRCGLGGLAARLGLAFLVLDPAVPWLCNFVSSDALFMGLSLIWITLLVAMIREPSWWRLALQTMLLLAIFNMRYAALFYPVVSALTFLLMRKKASTGFKLAGIATSIGVVGVCTLWIKRITYKETGVEVFSGFSGWQVASNVMNLYPFIPVDTAGLSSPECRELAGYARSYFSKMGRSVLSGGPRATTDYLWLPDAPLHRYMNAHRIRQRTDYFTAWNRVAPVFTRYGYSVIRRHPAAFVRYYLCPSAKTFFLPPLAEFEVYNDGRAIVDPIARDWFHYRGLNVRIRYSGAPKRVFAPIPWIYLALNIAFAVTAAPFLCSKCCRERNPVFTGCLELVAVYVLCNACFGIFASPTIVRYQVLTMTLLFLFTLSGAYFPVRASPAKYIS
jgi:hypothetical protein